MARRKKFHSEDHPNHERWLVSYADFITLLFAFFVVMYSISSVNEGKYRVLSDTLNAVFKEQVRSNDPIQIGEVARMPQVIMDDLPSTPPMSKLPGEGTMAAGSSKTASPEPVIATTLDQGQASDGGEKGADKTMAEVEKELQQSLQGLIREGLVGLTRIDDRIEIEIKAKLLFPSGTAHLSKDALKALKDVASVLEADGTEIQVEGHTDNIPISTAVFPSNWELSSARAASVVHYLARNGMFPGRMSAVGYAENRPKSSNSTAEGRAINRRVTLVVTKSDGTKNTFQSELQQQYEEQQQLEQGIVPWAEGPALE